MIDAARLFLSHTRLFATVVGLACAAAVWGASSLEVDDQPTSIIRSDDEEFARLDAVFEEFGSDDGSCLLVLEGSDPFSTEGAEGLRRVRAALASLEGVEAVTSLLDVPRPGLGALRGEWLLPRRVATSVELERARREARAHPLVANQLLGADGRTTLVLARLASETLPVAELRERVRRIEQALAPPDVTSPWSVSLTGVPPLRVQIFDAIRREQVVLSLLAGLVGAAISFAVFRRLAPVLITSAASLVSALWAMGVMGAAGETINLLNAALPVLVLVIALTDGMHLMIDVLRRREQGAAPARASAHAMRTLGHACMLTSLTTAIGFASLAVSDIQVIRRFGLVFAGAVALTFLAVMAVVPLLSTGFLRRTPSGAKALEGAGLARPFERLARVFVRHARLVTTLGILATAFMAALSLRMVPDNRLTEAVPGDHEAARALQVMEEQFGGSVEASILVEYEDESILLPALAALEDALEGESFAHAPLSALDLARLLPGGEAPTMESLALLPPEVLTRVLRRDLGRALVRFRVPDEGAATAEPGYSRIRETLVTLEAEHPGVRFALTGTGYVARRNVNVIIEDFALGLWVAAGTIVLVLAAAFRSLRLGLISVIPNAFPLAVAGTVLTTLGLELQVSSVLAFTVCLGIAVDDTIHLVSRFRQERLRGRTPEEAAIRAVTGVGRALVITTLVLVGGWATLLLSEVPTTHLFGLIGLVGLVAALVGDLLLLPAMLVVFARKA